MQLASTRGPQEVTVRGKRAAVVLSVEDYDRLARQQPSFIDDLLSGPAWDDELVASINDRGERPIRPDPDL